MKIAKIDKLNNNSKYYISNFIELYEDEKELEKKCYYFLLNREMGFVQKLCFTFKPEDINNKNLKKIINDAIFIATDIGVNRCDIIVSIDCQNRTFNFTEEEWKKIQNLDLSLKFKMINFGIEDERATWPIGDAKKADAFLKIVSQIIKNNNLSPLEILFTVWTEVTACEYIDEGEHNEALSRSVIGVLNSNYIVCVGFANYFRTLCEYINHPNIAVFRNNIQIQDGEDDIAGGHQNLIVHIKDDKYKIKGFYYLDPTFDATTMNEDGTISYFMLPLKDIKNLQSKVFNIYTEVAVPEDKKEEYENKAFSPLRHVNENEDGNKMSINAEDYLLDARIQKFILRDKNLYDLVCSGIKEDKALGKKYPRQYNKIQKCCHYLDLHPEVAEMYLNDNSEPIGLSTLISAYNFALKYRFPEFSKDEISLYVYDEVNKAILNAKKVYKENATNSFNECVDKTKDDEMFFAHPIEYANGGKILGVKKVDDWDTLLKTSDFAQFKMKSLFSTSFHIFYICF